MTDVSSFTQMLDEHVRQLVDDEIARRTGELRRAHIHEFDEYIEIELFGQKINAREAYCQLVEQYVSARHATWSAYLMRSIVQRIANHEFDSYVKSEPKG